MSFFSHVQGRQYYLIEILQSFHHSYLCYLKIKNDAKVYHKYTIQVVEMPNKIENKYFKLIRICIKIKMYQYNLKIGRIDTFFLYYSNIKYLIDDVISILLF